MIQQMVFYLVNDGCKDCLFLIHAFTLMNLPLKLLQVEELQQQSFTMEKPTVVFYCGNTATVAEKVKIPAYVAFISIASESKIKRLPNNNINFLAVPFSLLQLQTLLYTIQQQKQQLVQYNELSHPIFKHLVGNSAQIVKIKSIITQVAASDTNVLILGQSGTGKDVVASCIHYISRRKLGKFLPINCGAIPAELMESELFGHEKGAFTGAHSRRIGRFEMADNGTLFLDEIGDMPLAMQVKLLRVLQEKRIERIGGTDSIPINIRLIAATNKDLETLIQEQRFREDLYYRINVFPIYMPTLAERREDIPLLIDHYLNIISDRLNARVAFTREAMRALCSYSWPGNIRELINFVERMVVMRPDALIDVSELEPRYQDAEANLAPAAVSARKEHSYKVEKPVAIKEYLEDIEQQLIVDALDRANGIISGAAKLLSLGRTTLISKMKKYNISTTVN